MAATLGIPSEIPINEKENYFRMRLLLERATDVLRDVLGTQLQAAYPGLFDPSKSDKLFDILDNQKVKHSLLQLKKRNVMNSKQMKLLYPFGSPSTTATLQDLDITLAVVFLRNVTNLNPGAKWENPPASDTTIEANIGRVKTYRNNHMHASPGIADITFQALFNDLKHILLSLSSIYSTDDYDKLLIVPLEAKVAPCKLLSVQLPGKLADLKGREELVQQIQQHIAGETRLVLLTGMGGIGKTSLAIEAGHREQNVLYIDMRQVTQLESVKLSLAQHYHPTTSLKDVYSDYQNKFIQTLSSLTTDTVIIFDNNDEVIKSDLHKFHILVQDILNSTKHITLLCTCREAFSAMSHNNAVVEVPPLDKDPSIDILWAGKTTSPTDSESILLGEIAEKCGGNPLALKLLSVQLKKKTAQKVLDRMKTKNVIESFKVPNLPHSQEMMTCLDMSYETLNTEEQKLFRALHIFPVSFSLEEVSEILEIEEDECETILDSLSNKSILSADPYVHDLHPLLRAYAEFQARKDQNEMSRIQDAYCEHYMEQTPLLLSEFDTFPSKETYETARKILPHLKVIADLLSDQLRNSKPPDKKITLKNLSCIAHVLLNLFLCSEALTMLKPLETLVQEGALRPFGAIVYMPIGDTLFGMGKYKDACKYYQRSVDIMLKFQRCTQLEMALAYSRIGIALMEMGEYEKSFSYLKKCLKVQEETLRSDHPDIASTYNTIARTLGFMGKYEEALAYRKKSIEVFEKVFGPQHPNTALKYDALGMLLKEMGRYKEAITFHQKSIDILEGSLGSDNVHTASAYTNMGNAYKEMGMYREALDYHKKCLAVFEKVLGHKHPVTAKAYNNIGSTLSQMDEKTEALPYFEKSHAILKEVFSSKHIETVTASTNIGDILTSIGKENEANKCYSESLDIMTELMGPKHPETAAIYYRIGNLMSSMGSYEEALGYLHKCLECREEVLGSDHPDTADTYSSMGLTLAHMGKYREALAWHDKCLEVREKVLGFKHLDTASEYSNKGFALSEIGEQAKALVYYEKSLRVRLELLGKKHPDTILIYHNMACVLIDMGNYTEALEYAEEALNASKEVFGEKHHDTAGAYSNVGTALLLGKVTDIRTLTCFEKAREFYEEHFPPNHFKIKFLDLNIYSVKLKILQKVLMNMRKYIVTELIVKGKFDQASRLLSVIGSDFKLNYKF